jgi:archaellum component FlaD/FlaE
MAIDPRNYDLDELRAASVGQPSFGGRDAFPGDDAEAEADAATNESAADGDDDGTARPAASVAFERSIARDLAALQGEADPERPYLPALPASLTAEALIFEWLEFLVLQGGRESVTDALDFYERVGWLGSGAAETLERYLSGIDDPRADATDGLATDDHRVSLHYVARLASFSQR